MAKPMKAFDIVSWILCTIGALELGVVGAFNYDIIGSILGAGSMATRVVYVFVGLGGLFSAAHMIKYMKK